MPHCPLCTAPAAAPFFEDRRRPYCQCAACDLIFVPPSHHPSPAEERAEYDLHQNDPADPDYRRFLKRLCDPLTAQLPPGAAGLDFGCGPGPALAQMLRDAGHPTALYDPIYFPDSSVLHHKYDFVTATEVIEHLHHPAKEITRLLDLLKPGGLLGIMTKRSTGQREFATWHYKNDKTHVAFYSDKTFEWIAAHWKLRLAFPGKDVALLWR